MLLDREGPEVSGEPLVAGFHNVVAKEEDGTQPCDPRDGNAMGCAHDPENEEEDRGGREDSEDASNVEVQEIDASGPGFFANQPLTDEQPTDGEEEVDAVGAAVDEPAGGEGTDGMQPVVVEDDAHDGYGTPAIQGREVP